MSCDLWILPASWMQMIEFLARLLRLLLKRSQTPEVVARSSTYVCVDQDPRVLMAEQLELVEIYKPSTRCCSTNLPKSFCIHFCV